MVPVEELRPQVQAPNRQSALLRDGRVECKATPTFSPLAALARGLGELVLGSGLLASCIVVSIRHRARGGKWSAENILHWRAGCLPQEQVASLAHTHSPLLRPQQVMMAAGWWRRLMVVDKSGARWIREL